MKAIKKVYDNKVFQFFYGLIKSLLFAIIVLYVVFVIVQRVSGNQSILGYRVFTIATGSMEPVYKVNDIIVVKEVDNNSLNIGEDIAYMGNSGDFKDRLVTHRIINKETDETGSVLYETKGLANSISDPKINTNQIYGKVIGKLVGINFLNHIIKSQAGFFFLIFVPLVLVVFLEIADTIVEAKLERNELEEIKKEKKGKKDNPKDKQETEEKSSIKEELINKTLGKESDEDAEII